MSAQSLQVDETKQPDAMGNNGVAGAARRKRRRWIYAGILVLLLLGGWRLILG